jgi:hypothetical protein
MKSTRRQNFLAGELACALGFTTTGTLALAVSSVESDAIAQEAYIYFYPLVIMDVSRKYFTNVEAGKMFARGPLNTFSHARTFPPATFRGATHANFDTLYSVGWIDLTKGPLVISVPDTQGRYYLLQLLDMWTDSFAGVGKRTTGTGPGDFAVVGPDWQGELPEGLQRISAPTPFVWVIGRTRTDGPQDYDAVHKVQDGYKMTSLSRWGKQPQAIPVKIDPSIDMKMPPVRQVEQMTPDAYFAYCRTVEGKRSAPHRSAALICAARFRLRYSRIHAALCAGSR